MVIGLGTMQIKKHTNINKIRIVEIKGHAAP